MKLNKLLMLIAAFLSYAHVRGGELENIDDSRLKTLAAAFKTYAAQNGNYPSGSNWSILRQMNDPKTGIRFFAPITDSDGNMIDVHGHPYVFFSSAEGWTLIGVLSNDGTVVERHILLPPINKMSETCRANQSSAKK